MRKTYLQYYRPQIEADDIAAVVESLSNGWLTTGPKVREFEEQFATMSGARHAIAVNSCTAALQLGLVALGVGPGDEVVMPSLTFVAGAECVKGLGAEPIFCDVDESTLCITPSTIEPLLGPRTKAVIPMHYGGQPGRVREIANLAKSRGIAVLEDAAHAVGTLDGGRWPGSYSDAAAYSFYATKNITTAEGGMLVTNRDDVAERVRVLSLHGMDRDAWKRYMQGGSWLYDVVDIGYKSNLSDMAAALGISQLRRLQALQAQRNRLAELYVKGLRTVNGIVPVANTAPEPDRHSWCVFAVRVDEEKAGMSRDKLIDELGKHNIGTSVHFIPTHKFSAYQTTRKAELGVTERTWKSLVSLPLYPGMTDDDVDDVIAALSAITRSARPNMSTAASSY
jgi:dTDP-4-amino-4,6-dideoxygalactose transaminase